MKRFLFLLTFACVAMFAACEYDDSALWGEIDGDDGDASATLPPSNEIWYTSTDGNIVTPYDSNVFGANIVSNTYDNEKGIITFNRDVTEIRAGAFHSRGNLASVTIPDSVISIGADAFSDCRSLTSITIPNSVTEIGFYAFFGCSSLKNIIIPDSVITIESYAFYGCI